jgi:aspartate beta-hydroxylase
VNAVIRSEKERQQLAMQLQAWADEAVQLADAGHLEAALSRWQQILSFDPTHGATLTAAGKLYFRLGRLAEAKQHFHQVTVRFGHDPQHWINLALTHQALKEEAEEEAAITGALKADPHDLLALIMRAALLEKQGKRHKAAAAHAAVSVVAPPIERLHPDLHKAVLHSYQYKQKYDHDLGEFLEKELASDYAKHADAGSLDRFRDSVDMLVGRKRRFESQSMVYHYPRLTPYEFFDRKLFPWISALEAQTDVIRDEFLALQVDDAGFTPYVQHEEGVPLNQWAELNHSHKWSAFHLLKDGARVEENANRCPKTIAALSQCDMPIQAGRTPTAMFSVLKPNTRIPPHTGVSNSRLIVHLPLVVPGQCGFRVGNETREWWLGSAWVFDDTIEHEAWNNSDQPRAVLIFDTWHPDIGAAERSMVTAMSKSLQAFSKDEGGFDA